MIHFGTGGWRAVIGDEFTRANVRLLTQGLANRILAEDTAEQGVVIGYDRRFLSDTAAWWAVEVLVGNGIRVTLIDRPSPTPTTMWTVRRLKAAYGMAVTASHNPALYNGIKIFLPGGRDADLGVASGNGKGQIFVKGEVMKTVPESQIVETLIEEAIKLAEEQGLEIKEGGAAKISITK